MKNAILYLVCFLVGWLVDGVCCGDGLESSDRESRLEVKAYRAENEPKFQQWYLNARERVDLVESEIPDQVLRCSFDVDDVPPKSQGRLPEITKVKPLELIIPPKYVVPFGYEKKCLQLRGTQSVELEWDGMDEWMKRPFSISCIAKVYEGMKDANCVLFSASCGFDSTSIQVEGGQLRWTIESEEQIRSSTVTAPLIPMVWYRILAIHDGSHSADGMKIFFEFQEMKTNVVVSPGLPKTVDSPPSRTVRFSTSNVPGMDRVFSLDSLFVYQRALTRIEAATIPDGKTLRSFLKHDDLSDMELEMLREFYFDAIDETYRSRWGAQSFSLQSP
jgi:hypothetical protein